MHLAAKTGNLDLINLLFNFAQPDLTATDTVSVDVSSDRSDQ